MRLAITALCVGLLVLSAQVDARGGGGAGHSGSHSTVTSHSGGDVTVKSYFKSDGTYVAPHLRSAPDGVFGNNWTTKGNVNPYTGSLGTKVTPPPTPAFSANASSRSSGYSAFAIPASPLQPMSKEAAATPASVPLAIPAAGVHASSASAVLPAIASSAVMPITCKGNTVRVSGRCVAVAIR